MKKSFRFASLKQQNAHSHSLMPNAENEAGTTTKKSFRIASLNQQKQLNFSASPTMGRTLKERHELRKVRGGCDLQRIMSWVS